jgi:hypothetical protein
VLWDGSVAVEPGDLRQLSICHSTFVPTRGGLTVRGGNRRLLLRLDGAICGGVTVLDPTCRVEVEHAILDGVSGPAVQAADVQVTMRGSTVFGSTHAGVLEASDSLFVEPVRVDRRQMGHVEASFVPPGSRTPQRIRCQPDLALQHSPAEDQDWIRARLVPSFTSTHYGDPGYGQLTPGTPSEIRAGATSDGEIGAFHLLYQPLRMTAFVNTLREFLPAGRDVGVFFAT